MIRKILLGVAAFVALVLVLLAAALAYRAWRQHDVAQALAIRDPRGIDEAMFVRIGGIDQYIQIRGEDRGNPVILFLHGGPGISMMGLTPIFQPWEKYFTVVQWDQRGSGKTYGRNGAAGSEPVTIARMTEDGLDLAQFLRRHLHQEKIVVLGHSWGTVLGLRMVKARPDLFSAYVGTGQLVDKQANEQAAFARLLAKVRAAHDAAALADLKSIGPPPYDDIGRLYAERKWVTVYDTPAERDLTWNMAPMILFAPNYSLTDIYDFRAGTAFAQARTYAEINAYDARKLGTQFAVPFFIFEGDEDNQTPAILAQSYFDTVQAPIKRFVLIRGGGHTAVLTMPDAFLKALVAFVRPAAARK